jgi:membrane protein implicated in regulation of membrane protease activity
MGNLSMMLLLAMVSATSMGVGIMMPGLPMWVRVVLFACAGLNGILSVGFLLREHDERP